MALAAMPIHADALTYAGTTFPLQGIDGIYVINLKRRPERLASFFASSQLARSDVHVHEAFDGTNLTEWTPELETLFGESARSYICECGGALPIILHT